MIFQLFDITCLNHICGLQRETFFTTCHKFLFKSQKHLWRWFLAESFGKHSPVGTVLPALYALPSCQPPSAPLRFRNGHCALKSHSMRTWKVKKSLFGCKSDITIDLWPTYRGFGESPLLVLQLHQSVYG